MPSIPLEVAWHIYSQCDLHTQSVFPCCSRAWHTFFNPILYRDNVRHHGSSSVFKAIAKCKDETITLATLRAAHKGGASFNISTPMVLPELCSNTFFSVTPLYLAASLGRGQIVTFLLDHGADIDGVLDYQLRTPLFISLINKDAATSMILLRRGACLESSSFGINALHQAAAAGLKDVVTYLVDERGLDIDEGDSNGDTPLIHSLLSPTPDDIILHLKNHNVDINKPTSIDMWHVTPLSMACEEGMFAVARSLLEAGADATGSGDTLVDGADPYFGLFVQFPLELALLATTERAEGRTLAQKRRLLEQLLKSGADPNVMVCISERSNWTGPLLLKLIRMKRRWEAEFLLSTGLVDIDKCDSRGVTSLTWALSTSHGDSRMASALLRRGARPDPAALRRVITKVGLLSQATNYWGLVTILTREPKLLTVFQILYGYCFHTSLRGRNPTASSFLRESPRPVIRLITEMLKKNVTLSRAGLLKVLSLQPERDLGGGPIIAGLFA
ncbi:ankyrin repeat protein [Colletotrichum truncatum]|uniref:Ankyrin repeat protein n=1 Tax=Colletotrichum truncatum TaxID=5467 RepID=A0ACC3YCL6_COLTU|nr:ankyrin repeat protein [Colletotrichum truncatum]KAF6794002.1 ankyrin repeat protein [Colletotrichum truncatum]